MALFGDVLSLPFTKRADHANARAVQLQRRLQLRRTLQARRAFIRNARIVAAQNLVQGGSSDFGSSRFQGQQASIQTQTEFGLFEQRQDQETNKAIETEMDIAARARSTGAGAAAIGNTFQTIAGNT